MIFLLNTNVTCFCGIGYITLVHNGEFFFFFVAYVAGGGRGAFLLFLPVFTPPPSQLCLAIC